MRTLINKLTARICRTCNGTRLVNCNLCDGAGTDCIFGCGGGKVACSDCPSN